MRDRTGAAALQSALNTAQREDTAPQARVFVNKEKAGLTVATVSYMASTKQK
jgi:hypothetical protein